MIDCKHVSFHYDNGPTVLSGFDLVLGRRERLGIVGANGTGKSTLIDLLAGRRLPTSGRIDVGPTVAVGYYDQQGIELDPRARVQDLVAGPHRAPGNLADIDLMKRFWFGGEFPFARVGTLSGGERRRLQLLLVIAGRPNVLFLDEPTNDLDLDTLRMLEDFLEDWPGALVVVSHDRTFLDRTTEHLVAVAADGSVSAVSGGLAGWVARIGHGDLRRAGALPSSTPSPSPGGAAPTRTPNAVATTRRAGDSASFGRMLRDAEKDMTRLQRQRDKITGLLTGTVDHAVLTRLGAQLAEAQAALDRAEERWLTLAEAAEAGS